MRLQRLAPVERRPDTALTGAAATLGIAVVLMAPLVFTSTTRGGDYGLHQWLVWHQERAIRAGGLPSYFSHFDPAGFFTPSGVFWGGTLYGTVGYLAVLLGTVRAYVVAYVLLAWAALFGCWLLSRALDLRGWGAHVPGLTLVTGAWYLGEAFGRAGLGSFAVLSCTPLFVAGIVGAAGPGPIRAVHAFALVVGSTVVFGAHNLSLLWGTTFFALSVLSLRVFVRRLEFPSPKRLLAIALFVIAGIGVNGWFLVPNLAYSSRIRIAHVAAMDKTANDGFARPEVVFHPLRVLPDEHVAFWRNQAETLGYRFEGATSLYTQFPLLPFGWAAAVIVASRRRTGPSASARVFVWAATVMGCFLALVLVPSLFDVLPSPYRATQFTFRMHTYVLFGVAVAVGAGVHAVRNLTVRTRSLARRSLVAIAAFSVSLTIWQGWTAESVIGTLGYEVPRSRILASPHAATFWYPYNDFWDASARVVHGVDHIVGLGPYEQLDDGRLRTTVELPVADAVALRLGTGPYLVRVTGVRVLGRTEEGLTVVEGARPGEQTQREVVIERARTWPLLLGPFVSLLSLIGLVVLIATRLVVRWKNRAGPRDQRLPAELCTGVQDGNSHVVVQ